MNCAKLIEIMEMGLEASLYINPQDEGLSFDEIKELCIRLGYKDGEIKDALNQLCEKNHINSQFGSNRLSLNNSYHHFIMPWMRFQNNDPRNFEVMVSIVEYIADSLKQLGLHKFSMSMVSIVEHIKQLHAVDEKTALVSINLLEKYKIFSISKGILEKPNKNRLSAENIKRMAQANIYRNNEESFIQILELVVEILHRRVEGKIVFTDPLKAFEKIMPEIGAENFQGWWRTMVLDLNSTNDRVCCTSVLVISAALCEGALSFIAASPIKQGLTMEKNIELGKPKTWKFPDLIKAACSGDKPLLDQRLREQLLDLNEKRQTIHAGYFMHDEKYKYKIPDIKPEQAMAAKDLLQKLTRAIIDWKLSLNSKS